MHWWWIVLKKKSDGTRQLYGKDSGRLIRIRYVGPAPLATPAPMYNFGTIGRLTTSFFSRTFRTRRGFPRRNRYLVG